MRKSRCLAIYLTVGIWVISHVGLLADTGHMLQQYRVNYYSKDDGLSAPSVLSLCQTSNGYMWIGTYDGLNRFDGVSFKKFNRKNTPSFEIDPITALLDGGNGSLWVGTLGKGVAKYIDSDVSAQVEGTLLTNMMVNKIVADDQGRVWAATRSGLFFFDDNKWQRVVLDPNDPESPVNCINMGSNGDLFMLTRDSLYVGKLGAFAKVESIPTPNSAFTCIAYSPQQGLWLGTVNDGVIHYDGASITTYTEENHLPTNSIGEILIDEEDAVWIGCRNGLVRFKGEEFDTFSMEGEKVHRLTQDREGGIWAGTYQHGLYHFSKAKFGSFTNRTIERAAILGRAIYEWQGDLLVGTNLGFFQINNGFLQRSFRFNAFDDILIRSIKPASDGSIWVGTHTHGVAKISPDGNVEFLDKSDGLRSDIVRTVLEDIYGTLWVGTGNGLNRIVDGKIEYIEAVGDRGILTLHQLDDGSVFVGTDGNGFFIIDKLSIEHFDRTKGTVSDIIFYCYETGDGAKWIASNRGVMRFHEGEINSIDSTNGLPSDSIFYVIEDKNERFWMGCNGGVFYLPKSQLNAFFEGRLNQINTELYSRGDGINASGMTGVSQAYIDSEGTFWFPTLTGVSSIHPDAIYKNEVIPRVLIESIEIDNDLMFVGNRDNFEIEKGSKRFSFRISSSSFQSPENNQHKIRLVGFDEDWISIGNKREFSYTNLQPGGYSFEAIASNNDGIWNETGASISFTLKPYFYQTLTFKVLLAVLLAAAVALVYFIRVKGLRNKQAELQKLVDARTHDLNVARIRAEKANESKSKFLATISHEIRNPMNGILGVTQLMLEGGDEKQSARYLRIIQNSGSALLTFIDDLLDYSKMESQKLTLEKVPFELQQVVDDCFALVEPRIKEKRLLSSIWIGPDVPKTLKGDPNRVRQIILNLLSNAVKFTEKGMIAFKADAISFKDQLVELKIELSDTGKGISDEAQKRLFQVYEQEDESISRNYGGTGLGLAICKDLVELMDGSIGVSSTIGEGSSFHFTARFEVPSAENVLTGRDTNVAGLSESESKYGELSILYVDDEQINLDIGRLIFRNLGAEIVTAGGAEEAMKLIHDKTFDAVFLDYYMPQIDGITLTRKIRSQEISGEALDLFIVAVSGISDEEIIEKLKESGVDQVIPKPISKADVRSALERIISRRV
jgi:signal transduction histidine kinase/ligand-binding sensor domain-containing protein/ActR/RegA family two-component response regulator